MRLIALLLAMFTFCSFAIATPVSTERTHGDAIGQQTAYLSEAGSELGVDEAVDAYRAGRFAPGKSPVLDFGIGAQPVWLRFEVENRTDSSRLQRLSIAPSWLDRVDVYFRTGNETVATYHLGDSKPFAQRPIRNRFFAIDHAFEPGIGEVFVRVQTSDPMVVAASLEKIEDAAAFDELQGYSYGFVYGFLIALLAYNATLYFALRSRRYLFYSLYLAAFVLLNIGYTGHGYAWLWPNQPELQLWIIPCLMLAYGVCGFLFAASFLDTARHFPRLHKAVFWLSASFCASLLACILFDLNAAGLALAFLFVFLFSGLMILLGILAVRAGNRSARYFLSGTIAAMLGALLTDLSVAGVIPYNTLTYRAVEVGMLIEATILALALAHQFRATQKEKFQAELIARIDPLTGVYNRRAFYESSKSIWATAQRNRRAVSVIMLDIDRFKPLNDTYGHAAGDEVLVAVAALLQGTARESDILARWGGEEFILLLPETNLDSAVSLAERLRIAIAGLRIPCGTEEISVTASLGVAQRTEKSGNLDTLISVADDCLYQAKRNGRNRVSHTAIV